MALLIILLCIVWLFFIIITNRDGEVEKSNTDNYKNISNNNYGDGIIFPIHIKYKMIERKDLPQNTSRSNYDKNYYSYIRYSPSYKCVIDNEEVTSISMGEEIDIKIKPGSHIIVFESIVLRYKT